jgi:Fur family peroxide stress response transcriptional regulator
LGVAPNEVERRVSLMAEGLRKSGLRLTHQRLEVAREVAASDSHPDVETVYRNVRRRVPTISVDTVYRTIATLVELGLVERVSVLSGPARYDANLALHHHYVCRRCGLTRDVCDPALDRLQAPSETARLGTVDCAKVEFRGLCHECARQREEGEEG